MTLFAEAKNGVFQPVGECIYCGNTNAELTKEHILMLALGGNVTLPKSSCKKCAQVISKFEQFVARDMWGAARAALKLPTRNKARYAKGYPLVVEKSTYGAIRFFVPASKLPYVLAFPELPEPAYFSGVTIGSFTSRAIQFNPRLFEEYRSQRVYVGAINLQIFARFLAKTAHAFARAKLGKTFEPLLLDAILGGACTPSDFVGTHRIDLPNTESLHTMQLLPLKHGDCNYVGATVRLFGGLGGPEYIVVVGKTGANPHPAFEQKINEIGLEKAWNPTVFPIAEQ